MSGAITKAKAKLDTTTQVVVRLKRGGQRFEVLADRETYLPALKAAQADMKAYRKNGVPVTGGDLQKYLSQGDKVVYLNSAKGQPASPDDIKNAFPTPDTDAALIMILSKGESQLSEADRQKSQHAAGDRLKELATLISSKVYNHEADTKKNRNAKYYTAEEIERELKNVKYNCKTGMSMADEASYAIKMLREGQNITIQRNQVKIKMDMDDTAPLVELCEANPGLVLVTDASTKSISVMVDPECELIAKFRAMSDSMTEPVIPKTPIPEDEDLTIHSASPPEDKKKQKGGKKKEKKAQKEEDGEGEDDGEDHTAKKKKSRRRKGKGGDKDDDKDEEADDKEEEEAPPPPKPSAKKGKKGKKHHDDSDVCVAMPTFLLSTFTG
eukprot:TRINITY_DN67102_c4_g4_i1.p1 TRINITY_DN67102_c4_g4~~TRINITY_DN67102_c4_g4_i1.p1  ORF type:complete len:383 (-),score=85.36 TRINITY_DN67102_c4_g4_i1:245-1393(-)